MIGATRCFVVRAINLPAGPERMTPAPVNRIVGNLRQTVVLLQAFGHKENVP